MESKDSLVYLGSLLDAAGNVGAEMNRRLGAARAEFKQLSQSLEALLSELTEEIADV